VTATTGPDGFAACFSIPADQHGAQETFTFRRTAGAGAARLSLVGPDGAPHCWTNPSTEVTVTCHLPAGPLTVFLQTDAVDATYKPVHSEPATP
jgi:hypothetical protein